MCHLQFFYLFSLCCSRIFPLGVHYDHFSPQTEIIYIRFIQMARSQCVAQYISDSENDNDMERKSSKNGATVKKN